jgi:hypothetical protein
MIRPRTALISYAVAIAVAVVSFAGDALAQDQATIEKLVQMNKKALDDYDTLEWESAKKTLLDALVAGKKAGLDNHPVMARTYVHLGAVYITGFRNRDKAIQSFSRALEIDPAIQLSRGIATQEVNDAFAEAKRAKGGGGSTGGEQPPPPPKKGRKGPVMESDNGEKPAPPPAKKKPTTLSTSEDDEEEEKDLPVRFKAALDCPNQDEAIIDKPAVLRCAVSPNLPVSVAKMYLMYLEPKKEKYTELLMTKTPKGWWKGKIPKKSVTGTSVSYYFEGRDASGKPVVRNGEESSPNHLLVMEEDAYLKLKEHEFGKDVENPLDVGNKTVTENLLGHRREDIGTNVNFGNRKWWIGLGAGTGFGYAKGKGLEAVNRSTDSFHNLAAEFVPGGAFAGLLHLAPEVGYQISPNVAISVEGRFQYIPQPAQYSRFAATGALSGLLKVMRYTKQAQIRFFGSAIAGGGEGFRFTMYPVDPGLHPELSQVQDFKDTVLGGPIIAGAGLGMYYEATKRVAVVLEAHGLAGFPTFSFVADGNLALQINFYAPEKEVAPGGRYVPKEEDEEPK